MESTDTEKAALWLAAEILGGQAALAIAVGFTDRRHVWPWFNTDRRVPAEHCPVIESATRAKGGVVVTCEQLRPDLRWVRVPDAKWAKKGRPLLDLAPRLTAKAA